MNITAGPEILSDDDQTHLAAASDVSDGIRDFVKDGGFLRRPTSVAAVTPESALAQTPEIVVSNVLSPRPTRLPGFTCVMPAKPSIVSGSDVPSRKSGPDEGVPAPSGAMRMTLLVPPS